MARLEHYFLTKSRDLKRLDAIGLLRYYAGRDTRQPGRRKSRGIHNSFQADGSWGWDYVRLLLGGFMNSHGVVTLEQVLNGANRDPALVKTMLPILSKRYFLLQWARQHKVACPKDVLTSFIQHWEKEHQIRDRTRWLHASGLTQRTYGMLLAERALIHWMTTQGQSHFGLKRSFVLEWARQNGVSFTPGCLDSSIEPTEQALEEWIVKQGPRYFGLGWSFEVALLREVQITGRAADLMEKGEAK